MTEPLITHLVTFKPADPSEKLRDSIGGHPYLPKGLDYPACSCGERMSLYFQFDIREGFGLPFQTGSHLTVFACEAMSGHVPKSWEKGLPPKRKGRLPDNYWEKNHTDVARGQRYKDQPRFYRLMLHKPEVEHHFRPIEEVIAPGSLSFTKMEEAWTRSPNSGPMEVPEGEEIDFQAEPGFPGTSVNPWMRQWGHLGFKVGGQPIWGHDGDVPKPLRCACGAPMVFVCKGNGLPFPIVPAADRHHDRIRIGCGFLNGALFNNNAVLLFACRAQCHPFAVYPVVSP
jgi:Domain of unknown function (DUF1963)